MPKDDRQQQGSSPFTFNKGTSSVPGQGVPGQGVPGAKASVPGALAGDATQGRRGSKRGASLLSGASGNDGSALFAAPEEGQTDPGMAYGYRKSLFKRKDEVSIYTEQMDARTALDHRVKVIAGSCVLVVVLIFLVPILPTGLFGMGRDFPTPALVIEAFSTNIGGFINWVTGGPVTTGISITFWQTVAVAVAGATLALNGCIFQGALKNALAAPSTLGIMSGGTLGTIIFTLLFGVSASGEAITVIRASELAEQMEQMDIGSYLLATQGRALFSMAGCFIIVALVLLIAHIAGRGKVSKVGLLIAGQVFTALITGVITVIRYYIIYYGTEEQLAAMQRIIGGSVTDFTSPLSLVPLVVPVFIGICIIMAVRFRLNLLAFHDEEARTMGIKTTTTRNLVIIVCTVLTGVVVSYVGSVGFVGFLVPHIARKVIGPDFRYLVPASMLFGSIFLLLAYYFMNLTTLFSGSLGTLTALVGAVSFLVIAIRQRARGDVDWI